MFSSEQGKLNSNYYVLSFFLVFKLYKSGLQIMHPNSDHLLGDVDIRGFLWWHILKDKF